MVWGIYTIWIASHSDCSGLPKHLKSTTSGVAAQDLVVEDGALWNLLIFHVDISCTPDGTSC